jgi:DNA-binding LacI/PurR family transcriptional regulator
LPTLNDIAKMCDVSKMTVSRVISKPSSSSKVSLETRSKVLRAAKMLNYRPSGLIHALKTGRTKMIGFVGYDLSNPFIGDILIGIQEKIYNLGYDTVAIQWSEDVLVGDRLLESIVDRSLDGVIITQMNANPACGYVSDLQKHGVPVVVVDRDFPGLNANFVGSDDFGGSVKATEYLISKGHKNILFMVYEHHTYFSTARQRLEGYREAMIHNHLRPLPEVVIPQRNSVGDIEAHREFIREHLLKNSGSTAIFANNDNTAADIIYAGWSIGLNIPNDLSVVGFSDSRIANQLYPALTTIHQDPREIGRKGAELMLNILQARSTEDAYVKDINTMKPEKIYIPTYLVERNSVASIIE